MRLPSIPSIALLAMLAACGGAPTPAPATVAPTAPLPAGTAPTPPAVPDAPPAPRDDAKPTLEQLLNVHRAFAPEPLAGNAVLMLSDAPGTAQLFRVDGADRKQVTDFPDRVSSFVVAPDRKLVVFLKDSGGDENDQVFRMNLGEAPVALTAAPKVKHTLPVFDDKGARVAFTSNARNGKDMDLYAEDVLKASASKPMTPVLELAGPHHVADWRGEQVLVVEQRSNVDADLHLVDLRTRKKRTLTTHEGDQRWEGARFSNDGKAVFALTDAGREFMALVAVDVASGKRTSLVAEAHDLDHLAVQKAAAPTTNDTLVYARNVDGVEHAHLLYLDAKRRPTRTAPIGLSGFFGKVTVAPDGKSALAAFETPQLPTEVYRIDLAGSESPRATRLTQSDHAGIDEKALAPAEILTLKSFDGRPVSLLWYAKPVPAGERRPVVVWVHGGPESQEQPRFNPVVQYLVAHGYAVAAPNVRGSLGYGKSFAHLDDKDKREDSVKDLSEVGKMLAARADVDPKRIALMGGSYGGYMVLAGLTLFPEQWAAGVDVVGIANFRTFLEQTAAYRRSQREAEYGALATDGALLDRLSPIHRAETIKAPLMVIHGTRDPRVPIGEARQVAEALKKRNVPSELLTFEDEGHGLAKRKNRLVAYPKVVEFLDRHVRARK